MLSREKVLELIAEEKDKYSSYLQLCAFYKIEPHPIAYAKCLAKTEILEHILKLI